MGWLGGRLLAGWGWLALLIYGCSQRLHPTALYAAGLVVMAGVLYYITLALSVGFGLGGFKGMVWCTNRSGVCIAMLGVKSVICL
jgi:hypothetical protein